MRDSARMLQLILALFVTTTDADALVRTAPAYLTRDEAREHIAAARYAGAVYHVEASLLLSIAHHESRYQVHARTGEPRGLTSCGVMTPEPQHECHTTTLLDGYLAGARHLRGWFDVTRTARDALLGYAGGFALIRACQVGPFTNARGLDVCTIPQTFQSRARWLTAARGASIPRT